MVVIATDDMRIASAAFEWGAEVALTSPKHLSGTNRVAEVALKTNRFEYVINIQGDEPLIDSRLIDKLVEKLRRGIADYKERSGRFLIDDAEEAAEKLTLQDARAFSVELR